MTSTELVKEAKDLLRLFERAKEHVANHPDEGVAFKSALPPGKATLTDVLKAFVAQAEPEWLDRPDSDGFWWLLLGTQFPILVFVEPGMAHYVRDTKRYRIDVGHERKYAKAIVPTPPKEEPNK